LCELQTIRAGMVASLTEWKNRSTSGMADDRALSLAKATIQHFTSQLEAVDQAIAETIDNDPELCAKRNLLVSISGALRANDDETSAPRKFRLEGVGELSRGHAQ
jgi:hypothetical protein